MTALAGIFNLDGRRVERGELDKLSRALAPYGSERQGVRAYDRIGLAFALDAFTPEDVGQTQPVIGGNGRYAMVFDGRIDNRDEIGVALSIGAPDLAGLSDATLAMRSFERWGVDSFLRWIADFALAVWDDVDHRLIVARDPYGYRPLAYYHHNERFAFASLPHLLHVLPWVPRDLDEQTLSNALSQLPTEPERTFYKGLVNCPAGHFLMVDHGGVRAHRYYLLADHIKPIRQARDEDYVEEARLLFATAVTARLRSNGPIGSFMSGGLDSSTTAVFAAEQLAREGKRLPVFTSVPEDEWDGLDGSNFYGDETPYVRAIAAQHPNLDLNLIQSAGRSHYEHQDAFVRLCGMPMRNVLNLSWFHAILEEARGRGIKVMLEGLAGNMTLSYRGDDIYNQLFGQRRYRQLWAELNFANKDGWRRLPRATFSHLVRGRLPERFWDRIEKLRGRGDLDDRWQRYSVIQETFGRELHVVDRARAAGWNYFGRPDIVNRRFWRESIERFWGSYAPIAKGLSALHRIDLRDPFGDRRIVEWCFGVPEDQFHRNGTGRWLIKRMMKGVLPHEVLHKPRDLGLQTSDWHLRMTRVRGRMLADVDTMADDADLARMIDLPRIKAMLEDWPEHTIVNDADDRVFFLPVNVPMAMQIGRFVQLFKGTNA